MGIIGNRSLFDGTHWFLGLTRANGEVGTLEDLDTGNAKLGLYVSAPDASTMRDASVAAFYDQADPYHILEEIRNNPQHEDYSFVTDQRYLDPDFRMQEATRYLLDGTDQLPDLTPYKREKHSYWIWRFCKYELAELTAKANRAYLQAREDRRQQRIQQAQHSLLNRAVRMMNNPVVGVALSAVGGFAAICTYSFFLSRFPR